MNNKVAGALLLGAFGYGLVLYVLMYLKANSIMARAAGKSIGLFNVRTVALECLGAASRKLRKFRTFHMQLPWDEVLKLNPSTVDYRDVETATMSLLLKMHKRPWTYPVSQREAIMQLGARAFIAVEERKNLETILEAIREQLRRETNGQSRGGTKPPPPRSAMGWRQVLGLKPDERDVITIKKAYRTRASKAHPDRGGTDATMALLNTAIAQARDELNFV